MEPGNDIRSEILGYINGDKIISSKALRELITEGRLRAYFGSVDPSNKSAQKNVERIVHTAPKLFAVLVASELETHMCDMLDQGLSDTAVFPANKDSELARLNDKDRDRFLKNQWKVAPLLYIGRHFDLPKGTTLDRLFRRQPWSHKAGTFGILKKLKVEKGHLEGVDDNQEFVLKTIEVNENHENSKLEVIMREVYTLRARQHENIVPVILSFTDTLSTTARGSTSLQQVNIMCPLFSMDMKEWMERKPSWVMNEASKSQQDHYLYNSVYQVLRGLAFLHAPQHDQITSHHDLKPRNIFVDKDRMMIADLGKSCLKNLRDGSAATETRGLGTPGYCPPENFDANGDRIDGLRGRAFDMWSMGCIMIEVAVLIVYGWGEERVKFRTARKELLDESRPFATKNEFMKEAFCNSTETIKDWVMKMQRYSMEDSELKKLKQYLEITTSMLRSEPTERLHSWEAMLDYHNILNPEASGTDRLLEAHKFVQKPTVWPAEDSSTAHADSQSTNEDSVKPTSTPLHRAAGRGDLYRIVVLLEKGWSLDLKDREGKTPLDLANEWHHPEVVALFRSRLEPKAPKSSPSLLGPDIYILEDRRRGLRKDPAIALSLRKSPSPKIWTSCAIVDYRPEQKIPINAEKAIKDLILGRSKKLYLFGNTTPWHKTAIWNLAHTMKAKGNHVIFVDLSMNKEKVSQNMVQSVADAMHKLLEVAVPEDTAESEQDLAKRLVLLRHTIERTEKPKNPIVLFLLNLHLIPTHDLSLVSELCCFQHLKLFFSSNGQGTVHEGTKILFALTERHDIRRRVTQQSKPWDQIPGFSITRKSY